MWGEISRMSHPEGRSEQKRRLGIYGPSSRRQKHAEARSTARPDDGGEDLRGPLPRRRGGETREWVSQDDIEHADDTTVIIAKDSRTQMCERMGHYDIVTDQGELEIQWGKYCS